MAAKILIVDDDEELRSELHDFLEGYDVLEAANGEAALQALRKANEIALVILDVMMPGMNGLEVLQKLKAMDPKLAIIILTGFSSKEVAIQALKRHADDYIEKPIDIEKIKDTIERLMEKRGGFDETGALDLAGKIEKVKYFVQRNCYKKTGLHEAAQSVCLSPKYLSRVFKQTAGMGFAAYRTQVKVEKAKELLNGSGYNVNQISAKLGYENPESFIRQFKKSTRMTPAGYRQKHKAPKPARVRSRRLGKRTR